MILADIANQAAHFLQSSDSDDGGGEGFLFLLLFAGPAFYGLMFARYRNTTERHHHESETKAQLANMRRGDTFVRTLTGLTHRGMKDANNYSVQGALNQAGIARSLGGIAQGLTAQIAARADQSRRREGT